MMPITGALPNTEVTPALEVVGKDNVSFGTLLQQSGLEAIIKSAASASCNNAAIQDVGLLQANTVKSSDKSSAYLLLGQSNSKGPNLENAKSTGINSAVPVVTNQHTDDLVTKGLLVDEDVPSDTFSSGTLCSSGETSAQAPMLLPEKGAPVKQKDVTTTVGSSIPDINLLERLPSDVKVPEKSGEITEGRKAPLALDSVKRTTSTKPATDSSVTSKVVISALISAPTTAPTIQITPNLQTQTADTVVYQPVEGKEQATNVAEPMAQGAIKARGREKLSVSAVSSGQRENTPGESSDTTSNLLSPNMTALAARPEADIAALDGSPSRRLEVAQIVGFVGAVPHVASGESNLTVASAHPSIRMETATPPVASLVTSTDSRSEVYGGAVGLNHESVHLAHGPMMTSINSIEIGVASGTHGWLKVRAELEDGVITASLASPTAVGREALHRELPSLTSYLLEERVGIGSVVVRDSSATEHGDSLGGNNFSGKGQQSSTKEEPRHHVRASAVWGVAEEETIQQAWRSFGSAGGFASSITGSSGSWLNVRV
jgi:hypothetical protein